MKRRVCGRGLPLLIGVALGWSTWVTIAGAVWFLLPWGLAGLLVGAGGRSGTDALARGALVAVGADLGFFLPHVPYALHSDPFVVSLLLNLVLYGVACTLCGGTAGVVGYRRRRALRGAGSRLVPGGRRRPRISRW